MAFSESVVKQAWGRASGLCECRKTTHDHDNRCYKFLKWENKGQDSEYGWAAHHLNSGGKDVLENCVILCQNCYKIEKITAK